MTGFDWLEVNWQLVVIPLAVFILAFIALFWLRRVIHRWLDQRLPTNNWREGKYLLFHSLRIPSIIWAVIISAYLGLVVSVISPGWKDPVLRGLWTLFIISVLLVVVNIINGLITLYGRRFNLPPQVSVILKSVIRISVFLIGLLSILQLWGVPTSPALLFIAVLVLLAVLALRDVLPNLFAGFQLNSAQHVKIGDYIKLETGEEGYVDAVKWNNTQIKALDGSLVIVPNSRLLKQKIVNYGHPLKQAKEPFYFVSRTRLKELTGLKANNIRELVEVLKSAPDSIIFYHTHNFLEEHNYLTPEPSNDFAVWVTDALGDEALGERLASIDTFQFTNLGALRDRLAGVIEEFLARNPEIRTAMPGREFYFIKSVSAVLRAPYVARNLREFAEALRKIGPGSLYFHIFESRLRLGKEMNDFSLWLQDSLGETELAEEIARIDPYTYTLEGLKSLLIQLVEKRIR